MTKEKTILEAVYDIQRALGKDPSTVVLHPQSVGTILFRVVKITRTVDGQVHVKPGPDVEEVTFQADFEGSEFTSGFEGPFQYGVFTGPWFGGDGTPQLTFSIVIVDPARQGRFALGDTVDLLTGR